MTSKRFFLVMIALTVLLMVVFGTGAYFANNTLKKEGDKLVELKLQSKVLDKQQTDLQQANKDIAEYSELETITKSIVPQDKDQASTIAEIANIANQAGISLGAIEFPESELGQVAKKGAKAKAATPTDNSKTQLTELEDLKGVYVMNIDISSHKDGPAQYQQIVNFLGLLESNRRTAQVTNISIRPDSENKNLFHFSVTLNTYVRPE